MVKPDAGNRAGRVNLDGSPSFPTPVDHASGRALRAAAPLKVTLNASALLVGSGTSFTELGARRSGRALP